MRPEQVAITPFESHLQEVALRVRRAIIRAARAANVDMSQPRVAARELGVDKTLAWKISRIATGPDPLGAISMLPGESSQRDLLAALERAGVAADLVEEARLAMREFGQVVAMHADDRETLEMMLVPSVAGEDRQAREEAHRKLAFQGNSAIWGVQCRLRTWTYIWAPSSTPHFGDLAILASYVDVRRLRRDASLTLARMTAVDDLGRPLDQKRIAPLQEPGDPEDPLVLRSFCRGPLPQIERLRQEDGLLQYRMTGGEVGNVGAFTWALGWKHFRGAENRRSSTNTRAEFALRVAMPMESALMDLLVHTDVWPTISPAFRVDSLLPGEPNVPTVTWPRSSISVNQPIEHISAGRVDVSVPDLADYAEMVETACGSLGCALSEFNVFRVRMKYPILPSAMVFSAELPDTPPAMNT